MNLKDSEKSKRDATILSKGIDVEKFNPNECGWRRTETLRRLMEEDPA